MRTFIGAALALAIATGAARPAMAQDGGADVRCMLVANVFARVDPDMKKKAFSQAAALFFSGRVAALLTPAQIRTQIAAQAKSIDKTNGGPVMTACAKRFQEQQRMLQGIGQDVQRTLAPPPATPAPAPKK